MNPQIDQWLLDSGRWQEELSLLRSIILDCGLMEEYKWKQPCYTINGKNIVLIHGFKEYCAVLFMKGSLLSDIDKILTVPTENSQSGRQIRFKSVREINRLKTLIKAYVFEAIEVEKAGLKVAYKKTEEFPVPEELTEVFKSDPELEKAFGSLTPGRQRGYLLHFAGAKQSATRTKRILENRSRILKGKGLTDCICGLSKRMPNCDGSHKLLEK